MPAIITHHLFGEESVTKLPKGIISDQEETLAFLLGNQGPDPFFFHYLTMPDAAAASQKLGSRMHREHMTAAFVALRDAVSRLPHHDMGIGRAFSLGMLSHYALDRVAHPFVYAQQYAIVNALAELEDAGGQVHALIEADIDSWMLKAKRETTVRECRPADELRRTPRIERVAGALTSQVARQAYGITLPATEYAGAVADMETIYRLIEPAGSFGARLLGSAERVIRPHSTVQALAHPTELASPCASVNESHRTWCSPFSGTSSNEDFLQMFARALDEWENLARSFVYGTDELGGAIAHLNYSGRKLENDESCDKED